MVSGGYAPGDPSSEPGNLGAAKEAARLILAQQTEDGAITMGRLTEKDSQIISYFGCFAAQGLVAVYRKTHDAKLIEAARRWVAWYEAHQNPDGTIFDYTGHSGAWKSTGKYDSTDSYAAVYLDLLHDLNRAAPDASWLKKRKRSIALAIKGIRLTMQPSGLTLAKPDYPIMYTMDNVETLLGLRAATELARALGNKTMAQDAKAMADRMEAAISSELWSSKESYYRIGVQPDGYKHEGLKAWYPDVMANLMAVAWLPPSLRNRSLYKRVFAKFGSGIPTQAKTKYDLGVLIWWGWAARGANDRATLAAIQNRFVGFERLCADGCDAGDLGHIARLCAQP